MTRKRSPRSDVQARARRTAAPDLDLFPTEPDPIPAPTRTREPAPFLEDLGDTFPGATARSAVSIATVTQTARDVLEGAFMPLWVRGEISDFKAHRSGHWYFCLRDHMALLRCVVWSRDRRMIPVPPDDGMQVAVFGQLSVYPARGEMQFAVRRIAAEGDGLSRKALELTRGRLAADGLLAPERKRPLARYPRRIAVVTSPDGAALHDIVSVVRRRAPHVDVVLVPATVQGDAAPLELCLALDQLARWRGADTVIIGRGGGAREDLRAFNDERVARALARCPVPTVSAVGHEIDVTICDLVADHRAPTPSAAAEAAVPTADALRAELAQRATRVLSAVAGRLEDAGAEVHRLAQGLATGSRANVERRLVGLRAAAGRLNALSPLATLARGYAIAQGDDGRTLASARSFAVDTPFNLVLRDGTVRAAPLAVKPRP